MVNGFRYALGADISDEMKQKIAQMHAYGLFPVQIMQQHTKEVRELAVSNGLVMRDMLLLSSDVRNICRKGRKTFGRNIRPTQLTYVCGQHRISKEHSLMDLNSQTQDDSPFTICIQIE
jgi:hypothetical protein